MKLSEEYPGEYEGHELNPKLLKLLDRIDDKSDEQMQFLYRGLGNFMEYSRKYGFSKTLDEDRKMFKMRLDWGIDSIVRKFLFGIFGDINKDNIPMYMRGAW